MDVCRKGCRVVLHQPLEHGVGVIDFTLPVFPDVDLVHLAVNNALSHGFNVVGVGFIGVGDRFPVRCG